MKKYIILLLFVLLCLPGSLFAQELIQDKTEIVRAKVLEVLSETNQGIQGTRIESTTQSLRIKVLEGDQAGTVLEIENDYIELDQGDTFFLYHRVDALDGREVYAVRDVDRTRVIFFFVALFIVVILFFSGKKGLRSLLGLAGSFVVILYVLIPSLLAGYPPVVTSTVVATLILFFAIYLTHGFNRISTVAFLGTVLAVLVTGALAYLGLS